MDIIFPKFEGTVVDETNYKKKNKGFVVFDAKSMKNPDSLRDILHRVNLIYGAEFHKKRDHGHQSNGGLDLVIAKEMKRKKVIYGFCASDILDSISKNNLDILHRIKQNMAILKKKGVEILFFSGKREISEGDRSFLELYFRHI